MGASQGALFFIYMALPEHLQKIVDSPKAQKIYKEAQYKSGVKHFGKEHTIKAMKGKYKKSEILESKKK